MAGVCIQDNNSASCLVLICNGVSYLGVGNKLQVFENKANRKMFELKKDEVRVRSRIL